MQYTIGKAALEDAAQVIEYLRQVGGESDNLSFGAEGLPVDLESEKAYIGSLLDSPDGVMLVAKENGRIIGNASLNRLPRRMAHRGEIALTVLKECWNRGVGGALMQRLIEFARENGFDMLELQVRSDNASAIHLYEKHGFEKICNYPDFFKIGGTYVDFDFMRLKLN